MAELNVGKLTQIVSAVIDIKFPEGKLPEINEAINVPLKDGGKLVVCRGIGNHAPVPRVNNPPHAVLVLLTRGE